MGQNADFMPIDGWDHLELYVGNAKQAAFFYEHAFGFAKTAYAGPETGVRDRASYVLEQDDIRLVLTSGLGPDSEITRFACAHGDGVKDTALTVPDAANAYREAVQRGARGVREPHWTEDDFGRVERATIATYGDNVHTFVNRTEYTGPFLPGYREVARTNGKPATGVGLRAIDHVVGNVEQGRLEEWVRFYEEVLGFRQLVHFDGDQISTEYSALMSTVVFDGSRIFLPINEPADGRKKSQIEEYLDTYDGPGVQHVALGTDDIVGSVSALRARGVRFMSVPDEYYAEARDRLIDVDLPWDALQRLNILVYRDSDGFLLQIFTETVSDRPTVFFEIIERRGATGFGEGNFKALFEAIERDQARRGNL